MKYKTLPPTHKGSETEKRVIVEEHPFADDIKPLPSRSFVSHSGVGVYTLSPKEHQRTILLMFIQRLVDILLLMLL